MNKQNANQVYVSDTRLSERYGVARQTVWAWVKQGRFPKPRKLSPGCTRWYLPEIEAWEDQQHAMADV